MYALKPVHGCITLKNTLNASPKYISSWLYVYKDLRPQIQIRIFYLSQRVALFLTIQRTRKYI